MKAVILEQTHSDIAQAIEGLRIVEKPIPVPKAGQVLVKIEAAPCNPSDLLFLQGLYGVRKNLPTTPGWEGAGTVVASGGGLLGWFMKGKRVACAGQTQGDGTWAEYYVADAKSCIPLPDEIPMDQAATMIINPLTAVGMVERAIDGGHKAIIQTAACSQVGKMVQVLAKRKNIPVINIVRSKEQVAELRDEKWVVNSNDPDFREQLRRYAKELGATIGFEAVGGEMTGLVLDAMPAKSRLLVYGALAGTACSGITPFSLIFQEKAVEGFWLAQFLRDGGVIKTYRSTNQVKALMKDGYFQTKIREEVGFDDWKRALADYQKHMTAGKVILKPF